MSSLDTTELKVKGVTSELPEEILASIVSHLEPREAGATATLSKLWRYVWTCTENLKFNGYKTIIYLHHFIIIHKSNYTDSYNMSSFINWSDSVFNQHDEGGGDINKFRVRFFHLGLSFTSSID